MIVFFLAIMEIGFVSIYCESKIIVVLLVKIPLS